jgi:hypothetical protein
MKRKLAIVLATVCLVVITVFAANPSFTSFITSQFAQNGSQIGIKSGAILTNTVNHGISAPTPAGGEAYGNGASAANNGLAFGPGAFASGASSMAFGNSAIASLASDITIGTGSASGPNAINIGSGTASGANSVYIGTGAGAVNTAATAVGSSSSASGVNGSAFGAGATDGNDNSTSIGQNATTTSNHQIMLGTASDSVFFPGTTFGPGVTNFALLTGTQTFTGVNTMSNVGNAFTGSFTGNGAGLTNIPSTSISGLNTNGLIVISTNLALGSFTNTFGVPLRVDAMFAVSTEAAVAGKCVLTVALTGANGFTNQLTQVTVLAQVFTGGDTNAVPGFTMATNAVLTLSDNSSGAGNSVSIASGTQISYVQQFTSTLPLVVTPAVSGTNFNLDLSLGNNLEFDVLPTGNFTMTVINATKAGQRFLVKIKQDVPGNRTFGTNGTAPALRFGSDITGITCSTNASYADHVMLRYDATDARVDVEGFTRGYH